MSDPCIHVEGVGIDVLIGQGKNLVLKYVKKKTEKKTEKNELNVVVLKCSYGRYKILHDTNGNTAC